MLASALLASALVLSAAPGSAAWAASSSKTRAGKSQLALATASNDAVEAELARLDRALVVQRARSDDAQRAEAAAQAKVREATDRLAAIDGRLHDLRGQLAHQAIQAYTDPGGQGGLMTVMTRGGSLDQLAQRQALLETVRSSATDVVQGLRGTRQDQDAAAGRLDAARKLASERAKTETAHTKALEATRATQEATHVELQKRIAGLLGESQSLAAGEPGLQELIRARTSAPGEVVGSGAKSAAGLIWPVHGPVSSEFGPRWGGFHPGIDIAVPTGVPIAAAAAGTVVVSGPNGGYGNFVVVDHHNGYATAYAHQSRIAVSEGQNVSQGQVIGYVGTTGFSTGPHLHFEVRVNGTAQNPRNFESGAP